MPFFNFFLIRRCRSKACTKVCPLSRLLACRTIQFNNTDETPMRCINRNAYQIVFQPIPTDCRFVNARPRNGDRVQNYS